MYTQHLFIVLRGMYGTAVKAPTNNKGRGKKAHQENIPPTKTNAQCL